jgi:6-pyruvoyl-tetrahydropterin synthase
MFATGVSREFITRHLMPGNPGPEGFEHSHNYKIHWEVFTKTLDKQGYAMDISLMEAILEEIIQEISDVFLNDLDFFKEIPPSLENFCLYLEEFIVTGLKEKGASFQGKSKISLWENAQAWASYEFEIY